MKFWKQAFLILAVTAGAFIGWAYYLPAARPVLEKYGILGTLENLGLIDATQLEAKADAAGGEARRGFAGSGPVTVVAVPVTQRVMNDRTIAIGTAQSIHSVTLATEVAGQVRALAVSSGTYVEAGALIAELDSEAARIALDRAELGLEDQRRSLDRLQRLRASGAVPELQLQEAEVAFKSAELAVREARFQLGRHRITAPISGWVGILAVGLGDLVSPGTEITTIEDRSELLVAFRVPERMASRIRTGEAVEAASLADPGRALIGQISAIDNKVDDASRSLRVQATLPNEDDRMRPGMAISLAIDLVGDAHPAIDPLAIQWGANGAYVWILRDGKAMQMPVRIIQRNASDALVEAEFAPGDLVVTEGVMSLRPGQEAQAAGSTQG